MIPQNLGNINNISDDTFGNIRKSVLSDKILITIMLVPTNDDCELISEYIPVNICQEKSKYTSVSIKLDLIKVVHVLMVIPLNF